MMMTEDMVMFFQNNKTGIYRSQAAMPASDDAAAQAVVLVRMTGMFASSLPLCLESGGCRTQAACSSCNMLMDLDSRLQIGWNDASKYWLVRTSLGTGFADAGYAKVCMQHGSSILWATSRLMHPRTSMLTVLGALQIGYGQAGLAAAGGMYSLKWRRELLPGCPYHACRLGHQQTVHACERQLPAGLLLRCMHCDALS
jgi:hypothetical protein